MDALVKRSIQEVEAKKRSNVPWNFDHPHQQQCFTYIDNEWKPNQSPTPDPSLSKIAVLSWNIDFMLPFADSRMTRGVDHLQKLVDENDQNTIAIVIYLQECVESDVKLLTTHPWIRSTFSISDLDISNWQSGHYGTVTLVDRRLPISSCFRVHYSKTRMERDGLFVDVRLQEKVARLCNTHLESLALEPPYRPAQIKLCAAYMRAPNVDAAVAAGDFNAIQAFDRTLHSESGLKDAYLESGGSEDDPTGHTWGQQAATSLRKQFGTSRMDKVYFCGQLELLSFEKFGTGVCVEGASERKQITELGFDEPWITDHLGVEAVFSL